MKAIEVQSLTKYYKKSKGIEDVSFHVDKGEIFGFIGPNGAGKSTTIRTLLNFIHPTSGSGKIFDLDIVTDTRAIKKLVGYLPSEVHYYDDMKAMDLLKYSAKFYEYENEKRIDELANILQLELNRKIEDLSFGNRKKVGIIQALLHEPKLLILDEPTGGLDPLIQKLFFELLQAEREKGTSIFFSSHILSEVQKVCDRVGIIKEGKLVKVENIETLMKSSLKNITVHVEGNPEFPLEGVIQKEQMKDEIILTYNGDLTVLFNYLSSIEVKDILIEEPSLEEVFIHYYE
ncbi:ABC transporter ATP-binding protein [Bacillus sp. 2205SS5-2]|uniref:ABC transporter ATP-binding protein n=1 Tax=Bacillus sp. 2205SS5-2 TaxID=3109031 RepID=UPI003005AA63